MQSIKDIKQLFEQAEKEQWNALFSQYKTDERAGVQKLITQYENKLIKYKKEQERLYRMLEFERKYGDEFSCICGIDEAGRGPFAGPVVAGAVILPKGLTIEGLNDSKQVSAKKREELYDEIKEKAVSVGIGMSSPARIDEINILQATYEAMRHAVEDFGCCSGFVIKRCSYDSFDSDSSGRYCKRRCKKFIHSGCQHYGKGYEGPHDGRICRSLSGVRL